MYDVIPAGEFQPGSVALWGRRADFDIWRNIVRECSEELLGRPSTRHTHQADRLRQLAVRPPNVGTPSRGSSGLYYLGMGVDPLTFAADILTAAVFDAPVFDELFGRLVTHNDKGRVLASVPFHRDAVDRFVKDEPTQAAGSALLSLAWRRRSHLVG